MTLPADKIRQSAELLNKAETIAVSSGAGISKESGIPTFRDAMTGLWKEYDPKQLATPSAFRRDPDFVWSWYMYRRGLVESCAPNDGHYAVAELEDLFPKVVVLTQNIDGLHRAAGTSDVVELHGNIHRYKCFKACRGEPTVVDLEAIDFDEDHAPPCPQCGAPVRPDVVWFGENLPEEALERSFKEAQRCDVMLVVGTSGIVQPAASLPYQAKSTGAVIIEVNPNESGITPIADNFLAGPSGEILPALVREIRRLRSNGSNE